MMFSHLMCLSDSTIGLMKEYVYIVEIYIAYYTSKSGIWLVIS